MNPERFITGGYKSRHYPSQVFPNVYEAEAFDVGVQAHRWGQVKPQDADEAVGWLHEQLRDEKRRECARDMQATEREAAE